MATVRLYRGRWVADYYDQHRKRRIEAPKGPFENRAQEKRAAQALLTRREVEVTRGDYQPHRARLTFSQVSARYLESKVNIRPSTRRGYAGLIDLYLDPYFGPWKVQEIGTSDIERFRAELSHGTPAPIADAIVARALKANPKLAEARVKQRAARLKPGLRTINKCLTLLTMILNFAGRRSWVDRNSAEFVEKLPDTFDTSSRPLDENVLTPDEVKLLIEHADEHWRLLIKTAVFTGMRQGELLGLQWGDIDWASKQIYVRRTWKEGQFQEPKTKAGRRRVDIADLLMLDLKKWKLQCPKGAHDLVFPSGAGNPEGHANLLQRGFYPALRRAGLRKIRFHDLRHTFASLLLANGEDVVRVSRLLGHASPTITLNVYSHMLPKEHYGSTDRLANLIFGNKMETSAADSRTASGRQGIKTL